MFVRLYLISVSCSSSVLTCVGSVCDFCWLWRYSLVDLLGKVKNTMSCNVENMLCSNPEPSPSACGSFHCSDTELMAKASLFLLIDAFDMTTTALSQFNLWLPVISFSDKTSHLMVHHNPPVGQEEVWSSALCLLFCQGPSLGCRVETTRSPSNSQNRLFLLCER